MTMANAIGPSRDKRNDDGKYSWTVTGQAKCRRQVPLDRHGTSEMTMASAVGPSRDKRNDDGKYSWTVGGSGF